MLHLSGPGGIGKTTLLRVLAASCEEADLADVLFLDGRTLDPTPAAFLKALCEALGLEEGTDPARTLAAASRRQAIFIDTYEAIAALDGWLRDVFFPELPASARVVTAGRDPLALAWHADPGWQAVLREVPLQALSPEEARAYLTNRRVGPDQHAAILGFTRGHPLALSLVADLVEQRPGLDFQPAAAPDAVRALVDQFIQHVPGPAHRATLEAAALVRVMTESLLAAMLDRPDAYELFAWLRRLSFVEPGPFGLAPHDLAREALVADLRWRNPDWFAELHHRARAYYARRLEQTQGRGQQRVLSDYMYLHRDNPVIKPFIDWADTGSSVPEPFSTADRENVYALVARHEGTASAALAEYWLGRQPERALIFRGADREPVGYLHVVALEEVTKGDRATDPAVDAALRHLDGHAPLRPGERASLFRFWMAAETYQAVSALQSQIFLKIAQHYLTTPDLAFTFFPCADADFWTPFCSYFELEPLPEAAYTVGGRTYGVFGHDWRAIPPLLWLDHLAERELATEAQPVAPPPPAETLVVLGRDAFEEAVRKALRAYARPHALGENPLMRTRLILQAADAAGEDAVAALRRLLAEAAEPLKEAPREAKYYRALDRAYLRPAGSQEEAADLLDVPFSTFRRHLKRGVDHVVETLWQRELGLAS